MARSGDDRPKRRKTNKLTSQILEPGNNQSRYYQLLEDLPVGVYRTSPEGRIIEANQALAAMLGYKSVEDLKDVDVNDFYVKRLDRAEHLRKLDATLTYFSEFELRIEGGETIWVRDYPRAITSPDGAILYYDGILVDVTERKKVEEALQQSEHDYRQLFENAHDAILIFALDDEIILEANYRACQLYGYPHAELIGMSHQSIVKDIAQGKERIKKVLAENVYRNIESIHSRQDGSDIIVEVTAALMTYKGQQAILSINRDITQRKHMEEQVRYMAYHDNLTGLPNRLLFFDRFNVAQAQAKRKEQKIAVMFLDLDGFKEVNDSLGHEAGDAALKTIAERLQVMLRGSDTISRVGGDEFLLLFPDVKDMDSIGKIAQKILQEVGRPIQIDVISFHLSASIGIALYPEHGQDLRLLMHNADQAMYHAKSKGRNMFVVFGTLPASPDQV